MTFDAGETRQSGQTHLEIAEQRKAIRTQPSGDFDVFALWLLPCETSVSFLATPPTRRSPVSPSGRRSARSVTVWVFDTSFPLCTMAQSTTTRPSKVFRLRGLSASVFENRSNAKGRDIPFFKVSLQRTYKDGEEFKTTSSLSSDDLPAAGLLLRKAWEFILETEEKARRNASDRQEDQ